MMKKKYSKPNITIETMNLPLLVDTSLIPVGGTGSFDAKETSSCFDEEEEEIFLTNTEDTKETEV